VSSGKTVILIFFAVLSPSIIMKLSVILAGMLDPGIGLKAKFLELALEVMALALALIGLATVSSALCSLAKPTPL